MASETDGDDNISRATEQCIVSQSMIDITSKKLFDLRTQLQCRTTEDLIQNEIRESDVNGKSKAFACYREIGFLCSVISGKCLQVFHSIGCDKSPIIHSLTHHYMSVYT